jgi:hypothetical protein
MKTKNLWLVLILVSGLSIVACTPKARYDRMVKRELASGVRNDSLFFGLYLGMPEKEFYAQCWKLNGKGLIRQSELNNSVLHVLKTEVIYPCDMDFFPKFYQGKIYEMPVRYLYNGWTPWNKNLTSDKLQENVLKYFEKTYGTGFIEVKHKLRGSAYVKVKGNQRITILKQDEMHVWAIFTDLLVNKDWKNIYSNPVNIQNDTTKKSGN